VVEEACFLLGEDDNPSGPIGEALEQCVPPVWIRLSGDGEAGGCRLCPFYRPKPVLLWRLARCC
jgi:hypothetical protein